MNSKIQNLDDFLALLNGVRRSRDGQYTSLCPGHADTNPSLSITQKDDRILINCFAGCSLDDILTPLSLKPSDLTLRRNGSETKLGQYTPAKNTEIVKHPHEKPRESKLNPYHGTVPPAVEHCGTPETPSALTLDILATAKHLPVSFLQGLGISDAKYQNKPSVQIPYYDAEDNEAAIRYRLHLHGKQRFKWRKGNRVLPYGLDQLDLIKSLGWCLLVEGESDCWTLWYYGLPALGIPGKGTWQPGWAKYLRDIEVFLWEEPDASELPGKVAQDIPDLKVITAHDVKDVSEAHSQEYDIPAYIAKRKAEARPYSQIQKDSQDTEAASLKTEVMPILQSQTDIMDRIGDAYRSLGYGGDLKTPLITYLSATSRLLELRPGAMLAHLLLLAISGAGKSFSWTLTRFLLPENAYVEIHAGSPRVLIYGDFDLKHKVLIYSEADSMPSGEDNPAASALRNLLQDGNLHYEVTVKDNEKGGFKVLSVNKEGPTVLITTSTRHLPDQLRTRIFTHEPPSDPQQVKDALTIQGRIEDGTFTTTRDDGLVAYQLYLQVLAPWHVRVPFASSLAYSIAEKNASPRLQRDFQRILALVKSVAILRHPHRKRDTDGALLAKIEDYGIVYDLLGDTYSATVTGASAKVRELVRCVAELAQDSASVSQSQLTEEMHSNRATISRLVAVARKNKWLVNRESRKGYPADLQIGEALPERTELPYPESLEVFRSVSGCFNPNETLYSTQNEAENAVSEGSVSQLRHLDEPVSPTSSNWQVDL